MSLKNRKLPIPVIDIKKYGGRQIAITDGRVIASGLTLDEVIQRAKKVAPKKSLHEIHIFSVPKNLSVIYISHA